MEVMFVPYSARGHIAPMLAVASELVGRGVSVRMTIGARFAAAVRAVGVTPVVPRVGHDARVPSGWSRAEILDRAHLRQARRTAVRCALDACVREVEESGPCLVVIDPHTPWARRLAFPAAVRMAWLWTTLPGTAAGRCPVLINGLPELRTRHDRLGGRVRFVGPLLGGLSTPDPGLPWDRLRESSRTVVVTAGTVFTPSAAELRGIAREFGDSGWLVVIATGAVPVEGLGSLPDNVFAYPSVPQAELLEHADLFLTHAGMNSVLEAVSHGVPMLMRPRSREQRRTAAKVAAIGLGREMNRRSGLLDQARRIVDDAGIRARAESARLRIRADPSVARASDALLRLAGTW